MKRLIIICSILFISKFSWAVRGEFLIIQTSGNSLPLTLHIQSSGYAWLWNETNENVILSPTYDQTFQNSGFGFDCPKNVDDAENGAMPWGLMQFSLSSINASISFTIDFRDEDWATEYIGGPDIRLYFDPVSGDAYLDPPTGDDVPIQDVSTITIWDAYHQEKVPNNNNFLPPVFLKNVINSGNAGGTLHINSVTYSSGDTALAAYNTNYNIGTNNERYEHYQGSGITYKHNNWNYVSVDHLLSRNVTIQSTNNEQDANFVSLSPVTIQAKLINNGSNLNDIGFRDPWYVESDGAQPDTFHTFESPYQPTGGFDEISGGVFLNQQISSGVYYSVQASTTQNASGYTAIFKGWNASGANLSGEGLNENGYNAADVVFTASNATITANYSSSEVTINTTIPAGTYNFANNLTIQNGVTLTISSGTTLNFENGSSLIVNGTLSADGSSGNITFDFISPNSSTQNGIIVNQGGIASISYATISNAYNGIKIIPSSYQSTIQNCNVQDCYDGISVQYGSKDADLTISGNTIQNNTHYGISITNSGYGMNSEPTISNNTITGCAGHGIYIYDVGYLSSISGNTVNNNSNAAGIAMYYSSPQITGNEINNNYTGIGCASVSSPDIDNNNIQGNYRGVYSISSYPFLGQEIPSIDGGNNTITGNTFRDLQAESNSIIMAEHNWWGVDPPDAGKIVALTGSSIDYNPWLPDPPGSRLAANNNLPGININNSTLQLSVKSNNNKFNYSSTVSDQAQDNFDPNWDLMRKLIYAKSLIKNKFYNTSQKILKDIINTYPDSSLSSYAINLLWNSYRNNEVDSLKSFLYSLSNKNQDIEVYGVAEIILAQYDKGNTPKALDKIMKKYSSKNIKQTALFGKFLYYINVANDKDMARSVLAEIDNQYPGSYISEDAHLQLGDGLNLVKKVGPGNEQESTADDKLPKEYLLSDNYPNPFSAKG